MAADPFMGLPSFVIGLGPESGAMRERLTGMSTEVVARDAMVRERQGETLQQHRGGAPGVAYGPKPPRRPRVLLLTTRFSTVLQYSTRDTADAFERLGWDARVRDRAVPTTACISTAIRRAPGRLGPTWSSRSTTSATSTATSSRPDLPFVCWIQDHLPNLHTRRRPAVGPLDFVLTDMGPTYVAGHGYPTGQIVALTKLTRGPEVVRQDRGAHSLARVLREKRAERATARERAGVKESRKPQRVRLNPRLTTFRALSR